MRDCFAKEMTRLASERDDIALLSGDIGNRMFDAYKEVAPTRFINCGIAEANMMSVAAGMGLSGMRPVVYTITPFTTTRCLEQIRVGVAYHQSNVVIVGTGSGLSYAELGPTHHSLEDLAILRSIPGINVLAPCDSNELVAQLREALDSDLPTYIRIGKKGEPLLHSKGSDLGIGKANLLRDGKHAVLICVGPITSEALIAAEALSSEGISIAVACTGGVKPLDSEFLQELTRRFSLWITIEEHGIIGGLGSSLLEWVSDNKVDNVHIERMGTPDTFIHELGNQRHVRQELRLEGPRLIQAIRHIVSKD